MKINPTNDPPNKIELLATGRSMVVKPLRLPHASRVGFRIILFNINSVVSRNVTTLQALFKHIEKFNITNHQFYAVTVNIVGDLRRIHLMRIFHNRLNSLGRIIKETGRHNSNKRNKE
ncbi:unnamed protein product [Leptidea sinapis]|uniref:Uncharacterized protein n=1 Tax=Leptidea sinapis TaxID=189913 RepID=A0A5E4QVJ8_9NEOP|nr:unnamed protein product [Leptidea sinapis]